jgi:hypothetical protein
MSENGLIKILSHWISSRKGTLFGSCSTKKDGPLVQPAHEVEFSKCETHMNKNIICPQKEKLICGWAISTLSWLQGNFGSLITCLPLQVAILLSPIQYSIEF